MNTMLTIEEVKQFLDAEQKELEKYIQEGKLHAYKIGGTYLRFRKEEVENLRFEIRPRKDRLPATGKSVWAHVVDFWRFNNFYIVSLLFVLLAVIWMVGF